jgi:hypothetical protein
VSPCCRCVQPATFSASCSARPDRGLDWHIEGTGDFDGDRKGDILWRNDNGQVGEWLMDGAAIAAAQTVALEVTPDWKILGHNYDFV